ncbi:hypothetical protein [Frigidibacter oleivorans]|uniref:hypothetical protein n=1 Tax=Frigidibacter oleivorans TaxID=2487129 RepID=UPI000F8E9E74|nr:hypothetical protein [Frigidibacter oleivorans]
MTAMGLAGLAQGLAQGKMMKDARQERQQAAAQMDRWISALENRGASGAAGGGSTGTGTAASGGGASGDGTLFGLIDATEGAGNYDTLYGHSQNGGAFDGVKVSQMTLGELYDFASPSGAYGQWVKGNVGHVATPMGRHQIVGTTLRSAATEMGLSPDTRFDADTQNAMADHLASRRLAGAGSPAAKRAALRAEWQGFRHVSDAALDKAIAAFEAKGGMPTRPLGVQG